MVIDDEVDVLRAVKRRLDRAGYTVETAENAADGIAKINAADPPYDAVVTDMSMDAPESGLQVLHAATSRDMFAEVIVMTAYGNVANAVECMRRGAFDYIEKNAPDVDVFEVLAQKIAHAMDRRHRDVRALEMWDSPTKPGELPGNGA